MRKSLILLLLLFGSCGDSEAPAGPGPQEKPVADNPKPDPQPKPEPEPEPQPKPEPKQKSLILKEDLASLGFPENAIINQLPPPPDGSRIEVNVNAQGHAVLLGIRVLVHASEEEATKVLERQKEEDLRLLKDATGTLDGQTDVGYTVRTERPATEDYVIRRQVNSYERVGKMLIMVGAANSPNQEMPEDDLQKIVETAMSLVKSRL